MNCPKALLKVGEISTLERILEEVGKVKEIDEVYIVTNHKFKPSFDDWALSNEDRLGAIGDMEFVLKTKNVDEDMFVIAGDTLFDFDLYGMINIRGKKDASVVAAKDVGKDMIKKRLNSIVIDKENKLIYFEEKPENPKTSLSSLPIYLLRREDLGEITNCIKEDSKIDNMGNFIKYMINKKSVYTYITDGLYFDIGSKDELNNADIKFGGKGEY